LVKYPSTCKTEGQFYRFYDFAWGLQPNFLENFVFVEFL
jgi:hypothetical protein